MTKIVFMVGATSTKVGDRKPTKFYGGETEDIVDREAQYLLDNGFAAKPNSKAAKAFLAANEENPRTRRIDLNARTPGLEAKLKKKSRLRRAAEALNDEDDDDFRDNEGGARTRDDGGKGKEKDKTKKDAAEDEGGED